MLATKNQEVRVLGEDHIDYPGALEVRKLGICLVWGDDILYALST